jgi:glycosyltransferase involved in cell wall biosynthesis
MTSIISEKPKVSVVLPAYNEEMYLPLMLWTLSKLKTPLPIEIIGVNNASTDRTGEIITES